MFSPLTMNLQVGQCFQPARVKGEKWLPKEILAKMTDFAPYHPARRRVVLSLRRADTYGVKSVIFAEIFCRKPFPPLHPGRLEALPYFGSGYAGLRTDAPYRLRGSWTEGGMNFCND